MPSLHPQRMAIKNTIYRPEILSVSPSPQQVVAKSQLIQTLLQSDQSNLPDSFPDNFTDLANTFAGNVGGLYQSTLGSRAPYVISVASLYDDSWRALRMPLVPFNKLQYITPVIGRVGDFLRDHIRSYYKRCQHGVAHSPSLFDSLFLPEVTYSEKPKGKNPPEEPSPSGENCTRAREDSA